MINALVSIVMPAYNAGKYIGESIESVVRQTYPDWELLIVDDGSTDNTADVIKPYRLKDSRIKYFYQENSKQGAAKNLAIKHSKGEYIAFLDADDLWLKDKLQISMETISHSACSLLFTDCFIFDGAAPLNFSGVKTMGVGMAVYEGRSALLSFLHYNKIPNLTVVVKKEALLQAGGFTNKIVAEEYEMWLRLLANGAVFKSIASPLSCYRVHDESITAQDRHATLEIIEIIKVFAKKHPDYKAEVQKIVREKIKHWLYYGHQRTPKNFRTLITGVFSVPLSTLFYTLSLLLPVDQLRKIVVRLY